MNPFAKAPNFPVPPVPFQLNKVEEKQEDSVVTNNEFLSELREFMNDFAANDLGISSINEPNVMSKEQANFYVKLYTQLVSEEHEVNSLCDAELNRVSRSINEFRDKKLKELSSKKKYISDILQQYAAAELKDKKTKTIKLPYGNLSFKKQQPKYTYASDEELVLAMKGIKPELIKTKITESVDKTLLKKEAIVSDGQVYIGEHLVPGVTVQEQDPKFEIK